eukprot:CAMPEP_0202727754 /NCGR_PEP_ID=MMETSP1385-20130828/185280_1 /ASSEMBLY_ACC=CAM_ASM_000861 /TAXON_ID=933848 /ORGANISM="Elphidium margaritaceum" /LENGTH=873 /DNA_ID=CAMNT_0049393997 /DNA_START=52 /DNA_END=2672 /DNA_ORIENTATION=+
MSRKPCLFDHVTLKDESQGIIKFIGSLPGKEGTFYGIDLTYEGKDSFNNMNGRYKKFKLFDTTQPKKGRLCKFQTISYYKLTAESVKITVGDSLYVDEAYCDGKIKYVGCPSDSSSQIYVGVLLEEDNGDTDGTFAATQAQYFQCKQDYGLYMALPSQYASADTPTASTKKKTTEKEQKSNDVVKTTVMPVNSGIESSSVARPDKDRKYNLQKKAQSEDKNKKKPTTPRSFKIVSKKDEQEQKAKSDRIKKEREEREKSVKKVKTQNDTQQRATTQKAQKEKAAEKERQQKAEQERLKKEKAEKAQKARQERIAQQKKEAEAAAQKAELERKADEERKAAKADEERNAAKAARTEQERLKKEKAEKAQKARQERIAQQKKEAEAAAQKAELERKAEEERKAAKADEERNAAKAREQAAEQERARNQKAEQDAAAAERMRKQRADFEQKEKDRIEREEREQQQKADKARRLEESRQRAEKIRAEKQEKARLEKEEKERLRKQKKQASNSPMVKATTPSASPKPSPKPSPKQSSSAVDSQSIYNNDDDDDDDVKAAEMVRKQQQQNEEEELRQAMLARKKAAELEKKQKAAQVNKSPSKSPSFGMKSSASAEKNDLSDIMGAMNAWKKTTQQPTTQATSNAFKRGHKKKNTGLNGRTGRKFSNASKPKKNYSSKDLEIEMKQAVGKNIQNVSMVKLDDYEGDVPMVLYLCGHTLYTADKFGTYRLFEPEETKKNAASNTVYNAAWSIYHFLASMPTPLLDPVPHDVLDKALSKDVMHEVIQAMDEPFASTLCYLWDLLARVAMNSSQSKMNQNQLGKVFGPMVTMVTKEDVKGNRVSMNVLAASRMMAMFRRGIEWRMQIQGFKFEDSDDDDDSD